MTGITTGPFRPDEYAAWRDLFEGYADFYAVRLQNSVADTVWQWLHDPQHVLRGIAARDAAQRPIGLAHIRACPRTLAGTEIGFLDDLFVIPEARGGGAAPALFEAIADLARTQQWSTVRWITQHFNARGRAFYDRYTGGASDFILYQWTPDVQT